MTTAEQIERFLLEHDDWVKTAEIVEAFELKDDRPLRKVGNKPGLCSAFAISGDRGLKHIACATTGEWLRFKHRLRRHAIAEIVRVRDLDRRRRQVTREIKRPPLNIEKDTGQSVWKFACRPAHVPPH